MGEIFSSFENILKAIWGLFQWIFSGFKGGFDGLKETIAGSIMKPKIVDGLKANASDLALAMGRAPQGADYEAIADALVPALRPYAANTDALKAMGNGVYTRMSGIIFNALPSNVIPSEFARRAMADKMAEKFVKDRLGNDAPNVPQSFINASSQHLANAAAAIAQNAPPLQSAAPVTLTGTPQERLTQLFGNQGGVIDQIMASDNFRSLPAAQQQTARAAMLDIGVRVMSDQQNQGLLQSGNVQNLSQNFAAALLADHRTGPMIRERAQAQGINDSNLAPLLALQVRPFLIAHHNNLLTAITGQAPAVGTAAPSASVTPSASELNALRDSVRQRVITDARPQVENVIRGAAESRIHDANLADLAGGAAGGGFWGGLASVSTYLTGGAGFIPARWVGADSLVRQNAEPAIQAAADRGTGILADAISQAVTDPAFKHNGKTLAQMNKQEFAAAVASHVRSEVGRRQGELNLPAGVQLTDETLNNVETQVTTLLQDEARYKLLRSANPSTQTIASNLGLNGSGIRHDNVLLPPNGYSPGSPHYTPGGQPIAGGGQILPA